MIGLMLSGAAASAASPRTLPTAIVVHVSQSVTLRSMEGVQSEITDARAKLQRDHERLRPRPAGTTASGLQKSFVR
jgi:hypothetical protein